MHKIESRLNEESIWKKIKESRLDNRTLVRDIYEAAQKGDRERYSASLLILMHEAEKIGFHRGLLRRGSN